MSDRDSSTRGRPSAGASGGAPDKGHVDENAVPPENVVAPGGVVSAFVRRTDNDYNGVDDPSLLGVDIGDDLVDEDGEPIEE